MSFDVNCIQCGEPWNVAHVRECPEDFEFHSLSDPDSPLVSSCPCCMSTKSILRDRILQRQKTNNLEK